MRHTCPDCNDERIPCECVKRKHDAETLAADRARIAAAVRSRMAGVHPDVRALLEEIERVVEGG